MHIKLMGVILASARLTAAGQALSPNPPVGQKGDCLSERAKRNPSLVLTSERLPRAEVERLYPSSRDGKRVMVPDAVFKVAVATCSPAGRTNRLGFTLFPVYSHLPNTPENFSIYDVSVVDGNKVLFISGHPSTSFCEALVASTNESQMKMTHRTVGPQGIAQAWLDVTNGSAAAYFRSISGKTNIVTWKRDSGWHSQLPIQNGNTAMRQAFPRILCEQTIYNFLTIG